jgi:hypothetical protein
LKGELKYLLDVVRGRHPNGGADGRVCEPYVREKNWDLRQLVACTIVGRPPITASFEGVSGVSAFRAMRLLPYQPLIEQVLEYPSRIGVVERKIAPIV